MHALAKSATLAFSLLFWGAVFSVPVYGQETHKGAGPSLLVQSAGKARLTGNRLVLSDGQNIVWIADRPFRSAGEWPFDRVLTMWDVGRDSFAKQPPNAVLSGVVDGASRQFALEIDSPSMDKGNLVYTVRSLTGSIDQTIELTDASLFIDCWFSCPAIPDPEE